MSDDLEQRHDLGVERVTLGRMMTNSDAADEILHLLTGGDFYDTRHGLVFDTIQALRDAGEPADMFAVYRRLADRGQLGRVENGAYLHTLVSHADTAADNTYHAKIVGRLAGLRRVEQALAHAGQQARTATDPAVAVAQAQEALANLEAKTDGGPMVAWGDMLDGATTAIESAGQGDEPPGIPLGFRDLDRLLGGGVQPGQVLVIAGRPGMGKSVLAIGDLLRSAMRNKVATAAFSLEMTRNEVFNRLVSAYCQIPFSSIRSGNLTDTEWASIARMCGDTADVPLWINDQRSTSLADIRGHCRRIHRTNGLDLVVIDYLQLIQVSDRAENRQVAVSALMRGLKVLAGELDVAIVLAAQLNRGPEQRQDKRPVLGDLRESGSIEQDSDIVILLHRDDYYDRESPRAGEADFIVEKNRNGPKDTVTVAAQLHYARFVDMAIG